jgi:hypothetical protein
LVRNHWTGANLLRAHFLVLLTLVTGVDLPSDVKPAHHANRLDLLQGLTIVLNEVDLPLVKPNPGT